MFYAIINSDSGFAWLINIVLLSYENWNWNFYILTICNERLIC